MRKKFEKFLYGTAFSIAMTPSASWADEAGLNSAQNLATTPQSAGPPLSDQNSQDHPHLDQFDETASCWRQKEFISW